MITDDDFKPYDGTVDREAAYDKHIAPIMHLVFDACRILDIPFIAAFQFSEGGLGQHIIIPPGANQKLMKMAQVLYPDQFVPEHSQIPEAKA